MKLQVRFILIQLTLVLALVRTGIAAPESKMISLVGTWGFQLDPGDTGLQDRLFERSLSGTVKLPGSLPGQGIGDEVSVNTKWTGQIVDQSYFTAPEYEAYRRPGNIKVPFWLQPEKYYAGPAWYQKVVTVPARWKGRRITLTLERPHWETRVWVDGRAVGLNNSLATPHQYDLGIALTPGTHTVTIRVDNRMVVDVGENSHSVSDHTQGNWNGIVGRIELSATPPVWIDDLQVYPQVQAKSIIVRGRLGNATGQSGAGTLVLTVRPTTGAGSGDRETVPATRLDVSFEADGADFQADVPLGDSARTWDEFRPVLYRLTATLRLPGNKAPGRSTASAVFGEDLRSVTFGLREIATQGTQFVLNGQKIFIRGTLECAIFPATGHPPVDVDSWKRIIRIAKAHGLNNIRFHSWCPPEAAFVAADELGFYYQVECSSWANGSTTLGDGKPVDQWIYDEAQRILAAYGNHPSFLLMPYGNEPGGDQHKAYLAKWVSHFKAKDTRHLYTSGSGWPQIPENQFHVTADPRIQGWGAGLSSRINARPPETETDYRDYIKARSVPVISHEIGQWCVYPNFDEMSKYTGYLKPKNFEIFRDRLQANGLLDQAHDFLLGSGKLQTLCYKEDIESALRTPGMGGFQLLDLHDFPGQGTALVGVLDPFWESKGYVTAEEYRRFCNSTVPLLRLPKRVFTTNETILAQVELSHFGPEPLREAVASWKVVDQAGRTLLQGRLPARDVPIDNGIPLGEIRIELGTIPAPIRCKLVVGIEGTAFENDWDIWVYPAEAPEAAPADIRISDSLDAQTLEHLEKGGKVLLLIPPEQVAPDRKLGKVELGFSSIFWNTAWTGRQAPHTLGILCDPRHPALASFPTEYHSDWQWWYVVSRSGAMILNDLPTELRPIIQVIDDWFTARRLGLAFEAKIGAGKVVVASIDLQTDLATNPVARQLRASLLAYMTSPRFDPKTQLTAEQVRGLAVTR